MSVSDPIADMLTKVRNAAQAGHESVDISTSKLKLEIVKILKNEGYIKNFKKVTQDGLNIIRVSLKYDDENKSVRLLGVSARRLEHKEEVIKQYNIFDDFSKIEQENDIKKLLKNLNNSFGDGTIYLGVNNKK